MSTTNDDSKIMMLHTKINGYIDKKKKSQHGIGTMQSTNEETTYLRNLSELNRLLRQTDYKLTISDAKGLKKKGKIEYQHKTQDDVKTTDALTTDKVEVLKKKVSKHQLGSEKRTFLPPEFDKKKPARPTVSESELRRREREKTKKDEAERKRREKEKKEREDAEAKKKLAIQQKIRGRSLLGEDDSKSRREKSRERDRQRKADIEKLRLKKNKKFQKEHNLEHIDPKKFARYNRDTKKEIAVTHEWQLENRAKKKKEQAAQRKAEAEKRAAKNKAAAAERKAEAELKKKRMVERKAEAELKKRRVLSIACIGFFSLLGIDDKTVPSNIIEEEKENILNEIVEMEEKTQRRGYTVPLFTDKAKMDKMAKLSGEIFSSILANFKGASDSYSHFEGKIIGNQKKISEFFKINLLRIILSSKRNASGKYEPDSVAIRHFRLFMNTFSTHIRKTLAKNGYLKKPSHNIKSTAVVARRAGDGVLFSQTSEQQKRRVIKRSDGKEVEGVLGGEMRGTSNFNLDSLTHSQRKPLDSKFFTKGDYGQPQGKEPSLSRYFSYSGMIRSYEHNFYIPGDNTKYESFHEARKLEYQTNERSGTIEDDVWYSQKNDGSKENWVWKQSMKGDRKRHETWKEVKNNFKYNFVGKPSNPAEAFKKFIKEQENNPRYIIFKGITAALFRHQTTQQRNAFHYGFIDTESGIELGDYKMFECINDYHETSPKAFLALQPPHEQTPLMFFIHKDHLNPPKDVNEIEDWANKRSILSEYEYRELFLNKLMDKDSQPLMDEIQSLTDFTTAGKFCEDPNSINKNHTELCYSTGEEDEEGEFIYKSNVKFPEEQFKATSNEKSGILAIQYSILENFITGTQKKIEDLEKTECISMGEPCFKLILEAYDEIATFKTTTQQRLDDEMSLLTEYTVFLHQLLDLNLTGENKKQVFDEIEKVKNFTQTVTQKFMKLINGKKLDQILKNMFNKNSERLIEFKTIQQEDFQWLNLEEEKKRRDAIDDMEKEWKEQKTKFNDLMNKHFKEKWAEAASDLKEKIEGRDNEIANILLEYINAGKKAHDDELARLKKEEEDKKEAARLAKEEEDRKEAARLAKEAEEKAKEAARKKKEAEEKAKREKEAARKKVLLATLRKWQETYEKEKREEERRVLMKEIRKNYNNAIEHNIKIRKDINDKLEELGQIEKELLEKNDPDIYTKLIRLGSKWETQILSLKDKGLEDKISQCLKEFTDLLGNVNGLLTKYEDSHLSSYATNIKKIKDELEEKIGRCEGFIKEVKQHHIALLELNENFDDDGKVMDASLMDIHSAIVKIDTVLTPTQHPVISIDDVAAEGINEDPIPKLMKPIILELKSKLQDKEKEMKDVVSDKLKGINDELMEKKKEMENILKEYGYKNTPEEEEQNNDKITIIKDVIDLFDSLKNIMQEENNIEISIEDIFKEKSSDDEEKIPEGGWDQQDIEEGKNLRKTNEEELKELEKKRIEKEALEEQLNVQKKLLDVNTETLKRYLETLRNLVDMDKFKNKLKEAVENTEAIFEKVDEMKKVYEAEQGKDLDHGAAKASIKQILKQFEKKIIEGGVSLMKKREDIELIHDILENKLKEAVTIEDIEKIMKGSNGEDGLPVKLMMVPEYLINITTFLLEDAIYNKALLENNKHMAAAEKKNAELEQTRLNKEEEINNRIKKEKEDRLAAEKKKREEEEEARLVALEKNRLEQVARDKEIYEKNLAEKQKYFEEVEKNYEKLLSKYDESRYSKETQDLNAALMETIFKSGLLHSDQTYQEEDKPGHRQGVEDWFDITGEGEKMKEDNISYEQKLKKYNEAMKETNEIFG
jgi:hypothetical protein